METKKTKKETKGQKEHKANSRWTDMAVTGDGWFRGMLRVPRARYAKYFTNSICHPSPVTYTYLSSEFE